MVLALLTQLAIADDNPNGVIMLGDDVGYGDIGAYGAGMVGPYLTVIGDYQKTLEKYPNPKPVRLTEFGKCPLQLVQ